MAGRKGLNLLKKETLEKKEDTSSNQDGEIHEVVIMDISPTFKLVEFTPNGESEYVKDLLYCEEGRPCEIKPAPKIIHMQRRQTKKF